MKRILSIISICLIATIAFTGCKVKGGSSAAGINFVNDVFYVDYNVETFLDYKVYPSTSRNIFVNYDIENDLSIDSYFNFSKGYIKVINENFTSIKVTAKLNEFSDVCEVRLREYPTAISFENNVDYVNAGGVYSLNVKGMFGEELLSCNDKQLTYKVKSSDPSIVEVDSVNNLLLKSTGRRGSVQIDVQVCNTQMQDIIGVKASMTLCVVDNIADSFISLDNLVVKNNDVIELNMVPEETKTISVLYFSADNFLVKNTDFSVWLTNNDVFELIEDDSVFYLKLKNLQPLDDNKYYSVGLIIKSSMVTEDKKPHLMRCEIHVRV